MGKYSQDQLRGMSQALIKYKQSNPDAYLEFVVKCSVYAGVSPAYVERRIEQYAKYTGD